MDIRINRYFMVTTGSLLAATINVAIAAEKLTIDQMDTITAGAISTSSDANSTFSAFARSRGLTVSTQVKVGDKFARAGGSAHSFGQRGGASSNAQAIGIISVEPVPPRVTSNIPRRNSFPGQRLTMRIFKL